MDAIPGSSKRGPHATDRAHLAASHRRKKEEKEKGREGAGGPHRSGAPSTVRVAGSSGWGQELNWDDITKDFDDKEKQTLQKFLLAAKEGHTLVGPYVDKRGGLPRYMALNKQTRKIIASPRNEKIAKIAVDNWEKLGGELKLMTAEELGAKANAEAAGAQEAPAKDFVEAKLDATVPIKYQMTAEAAFDQGLRLSLGMMVYDRMIAVRDMLLEKDDKGHVIRTHGNFEFVTDIQLEKNQETINKIKAEFSTALDYLIEAKSDAVDHKKALDNLNDIINSDEASLIILRTKVKELEWNLGYWQRYGRLATQMMTPDQIGDFWRRMELITQLEVNAKGMEMINAQVASKITPLEGQEPKEPTSDK